MIEPAAAVSVVVPSIGSSGTVFGAERVFVLDAVRGLLATNPMPLEVLVVAGPSMPAAIAAELLGLDDRVRIVPIDGPFNFSASVDLGAAHATSELLLFLNDDVQIASDGWLSAMLAALAQGVGAVGARLLFEDGTLQHAGHTYRTSLDHVGFGLPGDSGGRTGILHHRRAVAGVTAACMLVPMPVFDAVGGFSVHFPGNYNDVDFCMKVRALGWSIVYEPAAVLHHFESKSRVAGILPEEIELIQRRWRTHLEADPFTPVVP